MSSSELVATASLVISVLSILWNIFFGYGKLIGRIEIMQRDIDDIKATIVRILNRMDEFQKDMHKMDVRLTIVEQRKSES